MPIPVITMIKYYENFAYFLYFADARYCSLALEAGFGSNVIRPASGPLEESSTFIQNISVTVTVVGIGKSIALASKIIKIDQVI